VKFGLSPFGIWRPGFPASIEGLDQYNKLYADAKLWLNKGWIDYFTPQLYWKVNQYPQSFPVLLGWWQAENTKNRHLWPGMNVGLGGDDKNVDEIINQIMITRGITPQSKGAVHWSIAALVKHELMRKGLKEGPYKNDAIVPSSAWLDDKKPEKPIITVAPIDGRLRIFWNHAEKADVFKWVVYFKYNNKWTYRVMSRKDVSLDVLAGITAANGKDLHVLQAYGVTAIDRTGNESEFGEHTIGGQ
jgi:hypothetical protein